MEHDYHKILRITVSTFRTRGKDYLSEAEVKQLLSGTFYVQEKLDGKTGGLHIHPYTFYFEDLTIRHTVPYDKLPTWKIIFDAWDCSRKTLLSYDELDMLLTKKGYDKFKAPLLQIYEVLFPLTPDFLAKTYLGTPSRFSSTSPIEGIIVKNYKKQLMGKIVDPQFEEAVDAGVHPMKRKKIERNRLA